MGWCSRYLCSSGHQFLKNLEIARLKLYKYMYTNNNNWVGIWYSVILLAFVLFGS